MYIYRVNPKYKTYIVIEILCYDTQVIASKDLTKEAFDSWSAKYKAALANIAQLEAKGRDEPNDIDDLCAEMETDLTLLGSTALEDKLQVSARE